MSEKLTSVLEEFDMYAQVIGLNIEVDENSAQYIETKKAFLAGMLRGIYKLTVEMKTIREKDIPKTLDDLVNELTKELQNDN